MTGALLDRFQTFAESLNHPEGVTWNPVDGHVYAGGEGGELYRLSLDGQVELTGTTGGSMLGLTVDGAGRVYACDAGKGEIVRFVPGTGTIETFARGVDGVDLSEPNVPTFGPDGSLYVTCSGEDRTEIVRIPPGGTTETWTDALKRYPNGAVVTRDGAALLVVEAKAERVARVPILDDGSAGPPTTFAELPDTDADGIALDAEGHVWVTLYRPDGLVRLSPEGQEVLRIDDHLASVLDAPTNIAFIGHDLDRAVVANVGGDHVVMIDLAVRGLRPHLPEIP